ncbi:MAG TPA: PAS domain-containing protein, partial [Longimicrobiaceae bacterium]|nr:PAS domain-containing protein [Longimicrobiaceae bacterium]
AWALEHRVRRADGEYRWMQARALPLIGDDGVVRGWSGLHADVTERKLAEQALRRGEEQLRFALDSIPQMVWVVAADGAHEYFNRRWYEYTGLRFDEARGDGWNHVLHSDDRAPCAGRWREALESGEPFRAECRFRRHDGEYRWFLAQALPQHADDGRVLRWFGTGTEIEEQKRARERAERLEERLRLALDSADVGTWDWDLASGTLAWDERCRRIFGLEPDDEVSYPVFLARLHPEDVAAVEARVAHALDPAGSGEFEAEYRVVQRNGAVRWARVRGRAFFEARGGHEAPVRFIGTIIDATEAKRAEEERERAVTARSRFYAAMSHELRTPINAVLGYNDLLLAGVYGELTPPQQTSLERGQRAARHLLHLVNDVLDLSKLEAGKMELVWEPVPVVALVQDLFATVQPLAEEHGSELRLDGRAAAGVDIVTDPRRLQQILLNLISNALKFGRSRPVEVRCSASPDDVAIEVTDQGVGIAPGDLARIFEEFIQLPSANAGGTGLGLPISQQLARLLGGRLEVESEPGAGSTFRLRLPRRVAVVAEPV